MDIRSIDLGLIDYKSALLKQKEVFDQVSLGALDSALVTCRHYPVITMGRQTRLTNLKISENGLKKRGIELYRAERGGDITYHGPGQLMIYPILNLSYFKRDIHWFLRRLEDLALGILEESGVFAGRRPGLTGVWVGEEKIASIGIAVRKWVTFHGLALNIKDDDLENFSLIRPCGMDITMTCMERVLARKIDIKDAQEALGRRWRNDQGSLAGVR